MNPTHRLLRQKLAAAVILTTLVAVPAGAAEHGTPLWLDLVSEDSATAAAFYADLFGWNVGPEDDGVRKVSHQGRDIASIIQIDNRLPNAAESQWLVGIAVDDLDQAVSFSRSAGGSVLREVTEVPDSGRYAVIRDPQGAVLILGTPSREIGGPRQAGFLVWVELWTDDVDGAAEFYDRIIGYGGRSIDRPAGSYTVFEVDGTPRAGLVPTPEKEMRPVWAPYIGVRDLAATVARTTELGGRVVLEPSPELAGGRVALIEDPANAMIFIAQLPPDEEGSK
jgi:predicted enzyme related to lactoylglutathione lyase